MIKVGTVEIVDGYNSSLFSPMTFNSTSCFTSKLE